MDSIPGQDLFISVAVFLLMSFVVVFPPPAAKQSGLVIPQIFHWIVKDEQFNFVQHHLKRSIITILVHGSLPLVYTLAMYFIYFEEFRVRNSFAFVQMLARISVTTLCLAVGYVYMIWRNDYASHPLTKQLKKFTNAGRTLDGLTAQINRECRDFNNFKVEYVGYSKVIVTENWVMKTSMYSVTFIDKNEARAKLIRALDNLIPTETSGSMQRLDVVVESTNVEVPPVLIRVYDRQMFHDLRDRLGGDVEIVQDIQFKMSINEQFVSVFEQQIRENPRYHHDQKHSLEACLGCQIVESNVKIDKNCRDVLGIPPCQQCHCKPMWCTNCIGRIFASKQKQAPETWMNGFGECPTCRARFCAFDVCLLSGTDLGN